MNNYSDITGRRFVASAVSAAAFSGLPIMISATAEVTKGDRMTTLTPYLLFDGNCQQAMDFYKSCFGGDLKITRVKESPAKDYMAPAQHEKVINARLKGSSVDISASDWLRPDRTRINGNTVCLYLSYGTLQELQTIFERLSDQADVTDPLKTQFFGTYGALNDKFGVRWMFQTNQNR